MEVHIIFHGGNKWAIRKPNVKRATRVFKSLKEAEMFARHLPDISKIFIHRKDGTVARIITFLVEVGRGRVTTIDFRPEESQGGSENFG